MIPIHHGEADPGHYDIGFCPNVAFFFSIFSFCLVRLDAGEPGRPVPIDIEQSFISPL